ncbi:unnamed protein product, partial [Effrenium voratum]
AHDLEEEADGSQSLLAEDQGLQPEDGALRSPVWRAPGGAERRTMRMQLRWFPEGSALCQEGGCSLYLVAVPDADAAAESTAATFELRVGSMRRVLRHDFSACPQWGCAHFGPLDVELAGTADTRVMLQVTLLEVPSAFSLRYTPSEKIAWRVDRWRAKQRFGAAAYVSEALLLARCPEVRLPGP